MRQDIQDIFDRYGVVHIVDERDERSSVVIHHGAARLLRTGPFELMHEIPVETNRPELKDKRWRFTYRTPRPPSATRLELQGPLARWTFTVPTRYRSSQ